MSNECDEVLSLVRSIARIDIEDGLQLRSDEASAESIRDEDTYTGVRVTIAGELSVARLRFHVDVNVGDPVWPAPHRVSLPRLLGGHINISGYPLSMVHAEKIVTAVQRGRANTRWRDFADMYLLSGRHDVDGAELTTAVQRVARHRNARLRPLSDILAGFPQLADARWAAWLRRFGLEQQLPRFDNTLAAIMAFADPVLLGDAAQSVWRAATGQWVLVAGDDESQASRS